MALGTGGRLGQSGSLVWAGGAWVRGVSFSSSRGDRARNHRRSSAVPKARPFRAPSHSYQAGTARRGQPEATMSSSTGAAKNNSNLQAARKRHTELFGSGIAFKRSRQESEGGDSNQGGSTGISPYGRCPSVSDRYEKIGRIGEGTYGVVYKARDKQTGDICALKRCLPHHEASDGFPQTTLREITILRELSQQNHPGIVKLKEVAVSSSRSGVFLVFEFCEHDLANLIDKNFARHGKSPFREAEVKQLSMQLLSAVDFLHSRHLIHRDIKLSNLLYNHQGRLRLADFGLCRRVGGMVEDRQWRDEDEVDSRYSRRASQLPRPTGRDPNNLTPKVVSLWYRPPELLLGSDLYDEGVDNWGAGCVIGELLDGQPLIKGKNEMDQITKMFKLLRPPDARSWPELTEMPLIKSGAVLLPQRAQPMGLLDRFGDLSSSGIRLLSSLLRYDRKTRWTAKRALESEYFVERPLPQHCELMPTFPTSHRKL